MFQSTDETDLKTNNLESKPLIQRSSTDHSIISTENTYNELLKTLPADLPEPIKHTISKEPTLHFCKNNICNRCCIYRIHLRLGTGYVYSITIAKILFILWTLFIIWLAIVEIPPIKLITKGIFRSGYLSIVHSGLCSGIFYCLAVLLTFRYGFWRIFFSLPFDRAMLYHRYCAYLGIIICIQHIISNLDGAWTYAGITGWICWVGTIIMTILSELLRRKYYNTWFFYSHWLFIVIVIVFGILHNAILIILVTPLFGLDFLIRMLDNSCRATRVTNIKVIDNNRLVFLEFTKKGFRYVAGQYAFINIPKLGLLEWHPFTLSCYPGQNNNRLSMHIKVEGNWTSKLAKWAKQIENEKYLWKNITIHIEGPHGELMLPKPIHKYVHVIFISGGIGITPCESLFNQLVTDLVYNKKLKGARVNRIEFIFTTRSKDMIKEFANRNAGWKIVTEHRNEMKKESEFTQIQTNRLHYMFSNKSRITQQTFFKRLLIDDDDEFNEESNDRRLNKINQLSSLVDQDTIRASVAISEKDITPHYYTAETRFAKSGNTTKLENSSKKKKKKYHKKTNFTNEYSTDEDDDDITTQDVEVTHDMNVNEFTIKNSTHITRIKNKELRKVYKETWSFINFERPKIAKIILEARGNVEHGGDVAVITSGPVTMIKDCIKWSHELGISCHYEIFDW